MNFDKTNLIQYDVMDSNGDVFKKGCFDKSIKKAVKQLRILKHQKSFPTRKWKGKRYARPFYTSWIIVKNIEPSWLDLKLAENVQSDMNSIYSMFGIPKEYMK